VSGATVLAGGSNNFYTYDPPAGASCVATSIAVTPWVNLTNGYQWTCSGGVWSAASGGISLPAGSTVSGANLTLPGNVAMGSSLPVSATNVAGWGDSLTVGQQGTVNQGNWPSILSQLSGYTTYNAGFSGQNSTYIVSQFLADSTHRSWFTVIESVNDRYSYTSTAANIASMVAALPTPKQFVVISPWTFSNDVAGSANYIATQGINSTLAAAYPANYINVWAGLIAAYDPTNLLDVSDHSQGVIPSSLRADYAGSAALTTAIPDTTSCSFTVSTTLTPVSSLYGVSGVEAFVEGEYILITAVSGQSVTACTRGYAGSTAATHAVGAYWGYYDNLHLNAKGYGIMAQAILTWMQSQAQSVVRVTDLGSFFTSLGTSNGLLPVSSVANPRFTSTATSSLSQTDYAVIAESGNVLYLPSPSSTPFGKSYLICNGSNPASSFGYVMVAGSGFSLQNLSTGYIWPGTCATFGLSGSGWYALSYAPNIGAHAGKVVSAGTYTLLPTDEIVFFGGTTSVVFPTSTWTPSGADEGKEYTLYNYSTTATITLSGAGGGNVNGQMLGPGQSAIVASSGGGGWWTVSTHTSPGGGNAPTPTLTSCGTSPTITGDTAAWTVTEGSGATQCGITWVDKPATHCVVSSRAGLAFSYTMPGTYMVVTNIGSLAGTAIDGICTQ
jgi:lysophospholipase L1-like esterase